MTKPTPEWLDRPEPARIPVEDFKFRQQLSNKQTRNVGSYGAGCLAKELANVDGPNSASDVTRGATVYSGSRELEDGTTEHLIGCGGCGAMCTFVKSAHKGSGPGTEDDPNIVISVAEAPQPNPWANLGTFDDCKAGTVTVPPEASALVEPVGLSEDQRTMAKVLLGYTD